MSPIQPKTVSGWKQELKVHRIFTDSIHSDCESSVILNDIKPYQNVLPYGPGGKGDYLLWSFLLTPDSNTLLKRDLTR